MAEPNTIEGRFFVLMVGDGATPSEVFTALCGLNGSQFNRTGQTNDRFIRDCAVPTALPWRKAVRTGKQVDITANGYFNIDNRAEVDALWMENKNYRYVVYDDDGVTPLGHYGGAGIATSINMGGDENDLGTIEITIASNGAWVWTDA